jgi:hypothetical protein
MNRFVMGLGLLMGTVVAAACGRGPDFGPINEVASVAAQCRTNLSGDLTRNGIPLGRIRSQAGALEGAGDWVTHASGRIAIQPICESHLKDQPALRRGEFVARIMIMDTATAYSTQRTDVVYLWVFERNGQLTSQLVSMTDSNKASAIKTVSFRSCEEAPYESERAGWHPGDCHPGGMAGAAASQLARDNPWFGCRLGCCYAIMPQS